MARHTCPNRPVPTSWQEIMEDAFTRQRERCGFCGKKISGPNHVRGTQGAWQAYHVNGNPTDNRLSNCVCLCVNDPENCHHVAHDKDTRRGALLKIADFPFWYG
jgi:hypothetical protein